MGREEEFRMTFLYPWLLWLLIPMGILLYRSSTLQSRIHALIAILILLSLSRPVLEEGTQPSKIKAKDLIVAIDVSYSMRARDLKPSRYDYAKALIGSLLEQNPAANIMLIAFTTNPLLLSPPTTDHVLIKTALNSLRPEYILTKGTSLQRLFEKLPRLNASGKDLILITDGGEENDLATLSEALRKSGTYPVILGLGSEAGTTIPDKNGDMLKNSAGDLVISRINPLLNRLSDGTDGAYLEAAGSPQATAEKITALLKGRARTLEKRQHRYRELYWIALLPAVLLFLVLHTVMRKWLLLWLSLVGIPASAGVLDLYHLQHAYSSYAQKDYNQTLRHISRIDKQTLQSALLQADSYYRMKRYKVARQKYLQLKSRSPKIKQKLYYNIANTYAMEGNYDKARIYYTKTLQLGKDKDAEANLALVVFLKTKKEKTQSLPRPKAQDDKQPKGAKKQTSQKKKQKKKDGSSGGNGDGGMEQSSKKSKEYREGKLDTSKKEQKHPLSSKVYELINKGYIRETKPW